MLLMIFSIRAASRPNFELAFQRSSNGRSRMGVQQPILPLRCVYPLMRLLLITAGLDLC
jgi:hypothetical protein